MLLDNTAGCPQGSVAWMAELRIMRIIRIRYFVFMRTPRIFQQQQFAGLISLPILQATEIHAGRHFVPTVIASDPSQIDGSRGRFALQQGSYYLSAHIIDGHFDKVLATAYSESDIGAMIKGIELGSAQCGGEFRSFGFPGLQGEEYPCLI